MLYFTVINVGKLKAFTMIKILLCFLFLVNCNSHQIFLYNSIPAHTDSKLRVKGEDCSYNIIMFPLSLFPLKLNSIQNALFDMKKNSDSKTDSFKNVEFNYRREMHYLLYTSECFVLYGTPVIKLEDKAGTSK